MGSTVSPDGRFLAATSTDKSVMLQIFDLKSYKLIWTVGSASLINQTLADGTVGQMGPTYSPDGKFLWLPEAAAVGSIAVGLHPNAMYAAGKTVFVTNTNSDTVSVIDSAKDQVVQTIETRP